MSDSFNNKKEWYSVHIFYYPPWEKLLCNCIFPTILCLKNNNLISKYFFIRYFELGPHIRLRIECKPSCFFNEVRDLLMNSIYDYILKNPSEQTEQFKSTIPNNSIKLIEYEPELERYGGIYSIKYIETHFYNSSHLVLKLLSKNETFWTYNSRLSLALKAQYNFANSFITSKYVGQYFYYIYSSYFSSIMSSFDKEQSLKIINSYENNYNIQKQYIYKLLSTYNYPNAIIWKQWERQSNKTNTLLSDLENQNKVIFPESIISDKFTTNPPIKMWYIYQSLFHMTNNRFGLLNHDEPFLAYLLYRYVTEHDRI
ncbi:thiopeptide-type bacteriocin biosynthesis protein [Runella limosa]|uniref:thiopeptide-type bacteriocin biosynthesis protein n=1 Tax=Runella limosa TaxID=370978 RepID=UPI00040A7BBF|nr:thiopeptide-type bacteriocin biosynthesis protein [Runella limosa]